MMPIDLDKTLPYIWEDDEKLKEPDYSLIIDCGKGKVWRKNPLDLEEDFDYFLDDPQQ